MGGISFTSPEVFGYFLLLRQQDDTSSQEIKNKTVFGEVHNNPFQLKACDSVHEHWQMCSYINPPSKYALLLNKVKLIECFLMFVCA